ncbi:bifunctional lysylphosphatidylglycerol flippase/synthetase MprF [Microbacterium sp. B2969]|uniref:Bifunctional lysylphosphatidylglycerol flippase/synthetase MprF n=1 Tax=Microbacterium alkaliflavum TaxID=3248839 RepID=A0ABW7QA75_9MICO
MMRMLGRVPATLTVVALLLVAGVVWQGLWHPFEDSDTFEVVAYGLPALSQGRWWTPVTGTFFVSHPLAYVFTIASFAGMGFLESRRGTRVALAYFGIGQLFAVLASALFLLVFSMTPWPWAQEEALALDVGASGGTMACIAAAVGLFAQPWRVRAWLVLLGVTVLALLFWGSLDDLEHAFAVALVLFADRSLRIQRTTIREQRLIAFVVALTLGAVSVLTTLVPTNGAFGHTDSVEGPWLDAAIDAAVALFFADGLRRGRRWAWRWTVGYAVFNVVVATLLVILLLAGTAGLQSSVGDFSVAIARSALWLMFLVYLVWVRHAFRARRKSRLGAQPAPTVAEVKDVLHRCGGGTLSWMTTWDGNDYVRTSAGIVAYQRRSGVAIVLADPLGAEASRPDSIVEFIDGAERAGLIPCFFSASEATKAAVPDGWRSLVVADDTIVDLPGLEFTGKQWNSVRSSLNRAGREEMTFRMTRLADEPWGVQQQLRAISEMWVGDKGLPEMGFTLGTLDEAQDPEVRLALAISPKGDVDGFLSWLPVYGVDAEVRGWTLDLMRRREGGFGPVMEYLIGASARYFSQEGARILSLSGAPLTHEYPEDAGPIADLTDRLAELLEPVYGFRSLHRFKEKFHPRYETMYLLYRDETDLTRIATGLTRAFLPDATLRQFASAGLELVRGEKD